MNWYCLGAVGPSRTEVAFWTLILLTVHAEIAGRALEASATIWIGLVVAHRAVLLVLRATRTEHSLE